MSDTYLPGTKVRYMIQVSDDRIISGNGVVLASPVTASQKYKIRNEQGEEMTAFERELELSDYPPGHTEEE